MPQKIQLISIAVPPFSLYSFAHTPERGQQVHPLNSPTRLCYSSKVHMITTSGRMRIVLHVVMPLNWQLRRIAQTITTTPFSSDGPHLGPDT